jgi:hypothetical protein
VGTKKQYIFPGVVYLAILEVSVLDFNAGVDTCLGCSQKFKAAVPQRTCDKLSDGKNIDYHIDSDRLGYVKLG